MLAIWKSKDTCSSSLSSPEGTCLSLPTVYLPIQDICLSILLQVSVCGRLNPAALKFLQENWAIASGSVSCQLMRLSWARLICLRNSCTTEQSALRNIRTLELIDICIHTAYSCLCTWMFARWYFYGIRRCDEGLRSRLLSVGAAVPASFRFWTFHQTVTWHANMYIWTLAYMHTHTYTHKLYSAWEQSSAAMHSNASCG